VYRVGGSKGGLANKTVKIYERVKVYGKWTDRPVSIPKLKADGTMYLKDDCAALAPEIDVLRTRSFRKEIPPSNVLQFVRDR
jgi:hypothetical protein